MNCPSWSRILVVSLMLPPLVLPPSPTLAGVFGEKKGAAEGPITLQQAAAYVDLIDRRLFDLGTIGVKSPDVWGQNRMTAYRSEYEGQMKGRLGEFQLILQAAQARADISALTSATSLGAAVAAANGSPTPAPTATATAKDSTGKTLPPGFSNSNTVTVNPAPAPAAGDSGSGSSPDPGNPDFTGMAAQLDAIAKRIDTLKQGTLTLPSNINTFTNKAGVTGVGIEPTIALDEESRYINHLHQLRRVNAGDDLTDMAGYGLYLLRMPISLMPGPESRKGKGAVITVEARHNLTDDLLPNTFRDVAVLDLTYVLTQIINEEIHQNIYRDCHGLISATGQAGGMTKAVDPDSKLNRTRGIKNGTGPNPILLEDLRIILGPIGNTDDPPPQPVAPAPSQLNSTASRARPVVAAKRDQVLRASVPAPAPARAPTRDKTVVVMPGTDRLGLLVSAMEASQCDPYRHDPSTMTLLQAALLDAFRYMRQNVDQLDLFQVPRVEALAELLMRRDYGRLKQAREEFLRDLQAYRRGCPVEALLKGEWESLVEPSDVLAFALLLQFISVDRQLKWDMKYMAQRRGCACAEVDGLSFYDLQATPEAREAFQEYVACKWPLHIYSVDPVVDQQNVLDAFSRRTELQLALAVAVSTGQFNIKNATSFARQLDLDLQTVGLNRTSVGFGAGETTFGWMFYPRVQTPQPVSNFRTLTNILTGTGQGINADLRSRRIEPGQRECIALMVTPNFIPSLRVSTVANWFDVTGAHARPELTNGEMLVLGRLLQQAKDAVARACVSREYRPTDATVLTQRIKQLEALLPTQDTRIDLPDEGDLMGSEIFSSNAAGLGPALLAWYGEPIQDGTGGSIFLQGRGFSVTETQVVVGGVPLAPNQQFRLISRNVMQIIVPPNGLAVKFACDRDHTAQPSDTPKPCDRAVIDVHVATPNGISNHLYVEVVAADPPRDVPNAVTTATTTSSVNGNTTTTSTRLETTPPGIVLPPLTVLPMGTTWPKGTTIAPGAAAAGAAPGSLLPGLVPSPGGSSPSPLFLNPPTVAPPAAASPVPADSVPITPALAPTSGANLVAPGAFRPRVSRTRDDRVGVAASRPSPPASASAFRLPPLPVPAQGGSTSKAAPASRRVVAPLLRRLGQPER